VDKKKFITIFIVFFLMIYVQVHAEITSVSGAFVHGQSVTISGSGFGTNPALTAGDGPQWLQDIIQVGTPGSDIALNSLSSGPFFNHANWSNDTLASATRSPQFSDVSRGGAATQSIRAFNDVRNGSGFYYHIGDSGPTNKRAYASWFVRANPVTGYAAYWQWKQFRATPGAPIHGDQPGSFYYTCQITNASSPTICDGTNYYINYCCSSLGYDCQSDGSTIQPPYACYQNQSWPSSPLSSAPPGSATYGVRQNDVWFHVEFYGLASDAGTANGSIRVTTTDGTTTPGNSFYVYDTMTHFNESDLWKWLDWQNYMGIATGLSEMSAYFTDVYVQHGSWARVEICTADGKHCEIQPYTAWSDTEVTIALNRGSFGTTDTVDIRLTTDAGTQYTYGPITLGESGVVQHTLTINNGGHASITSSPSGVSCSSTCEYYFDENTSIIVTADPDSGYGGAWSGDCTPTAGYSASVTMNADKSCTWTPAILTAGKPSFTAGGKPSFLSGGKPSIQ